MLRRLGRPAEAREGCDRAIAIFEALVAELPKVPRYRAELAQSYFRRGVARADLGDIAGAAADARRALALFEGLPSPSGFETAWEFFETACVHAALAGLAGRVGSGVSSAEAVTLADAAIPLLRKAIAIGYRAVYAYRTEDGLDPLRSRDDFRLLMMDLEFPSDPLAPDTDAHR